MKIHFYHRKLSQTWPLVLLCLFGVGCQSPNNFLRQTTPLPGWRSPTDYLFLTEDDLPEGWQSNSPVPTAEPDPTINANAREWYQVGSSITVYQIIWRSYTIEDAQVHYLDRYKNEFRVPQPPIPAYRHYCEFTPPVEITFRSKVANEFYLACGSLDISYCEVLARYRNYVTILRIDAKLDCNNDSQEGLPYSEIEKIIRAMDSRFEKFLVENPINSP
jgi:hypothetical protein